MELAARLFGQVEQDLCQPGDGLFTRLGNRVQAGISGFGRLQLFHLCHPQGTGASLAVQRFGQQLPILEHGLCLTGFRAMGCQAQGAADHFSSFCCIPGALEETGNRQIFAGCLRSMAKTFMDHRQVQTCGDIFGIQLGDAPPIFEGFVGILIFDVKFRSVQECLNGFLIIPQPFQELPHLLQRDRVVGSSLGCFLVSLKRLFVTLQLKQSQPQAGKRLGVVGNFFKGLLVGTAALSHCWSQAAEWPLFIAFWKTSLLSCHLFSLKVKDYTQMGCSSSQFVPQRASVVSGMDSG